MDKTGLYIHNIYGLTETNSPSHAVPLGKKAPVDPTRGRCRWVCRCFNTGSGSSTRRARKFPLGQIGEIATSGPQVVPGYWNKPEATAESLPGGELRTGDVGFMDPDGWFYHVDRKKDMINAAGYKVWPREVEDVLYGHPAVREAAVVGVPDEYRGETVKAYVTQARRGCHRGRADRVLQAADGGVQVPAFDRVRRRPAEDHDREDPAARVA